MMNSKIQKAEDGKNTSSAKKCVQTGKKVADKKEANKKQAAQVAVFENPEFGTVRTATDDKGDPWFCAKDLCDVLGYKNSSCAVNQHVRSSDVAKRYVARLAKNRFGVCEGKMQVVQMIFVNESGFYALVLGSKLATAVKFKDWVTSVVLPQIRTRYNAFLDPKCDGRKEKMGKAITHTYLVWTEKGRKFIHDLAHRFWELAELYEVKNLG